ncbi:histone H1 [Papiliotrema laurentii]|uniref:Histone H1 n=1 Tax=Papiliotrema laurentii TaxID=5418 RepID=A0AAD9FWV1_PAPLA|nr:histone H1 [Papiliotrema laurentii]
MAPTKKTSTTSAKKAATHPTFLSMIQEAVKAHPEEARSGVSRPTLKKYLADKYKIDMSSQSNITTFNTAIKRGSDTGVLTLPKGISGRVKNASKKAPAAGKENAPPKPAKAAPAKKAAAAPAKKAPTATKKAATAPAKKTAAAPAAKKAAAPAKKTAAKPAAKKTAAKPAAKKVAPSNKAAAAKPKKAAATATKKVAAKK